MNFRSLTRGDGVVIGAAVLLFIASFLNTIGCDGSECDNAPTAWDNGVLILGIYLAGLIGAALIVVSRALPRPLKVAGIELAPFGVAFTVFAAWTALGALFDPAGSAILPAGFSVDAGAGLILGFVATLIMAGAAVATPLVPPLKVALLGAPKPPAPQPYGGQPGGPGAPGQGYGYPGGQQPYGAQPGQSQPYGAQGGQSGAGGPFGGRPQGQSLGGGPQGQQSQGGAAPAAGAAAGSGAGDFAPFWFAVPVARPLYGEDGSPGPIAELAPGTWYLAVEQRGSGLVAQTQDGRRGVLQDTSGIQRG
ncbi:DUF5336 domain-containing protein [Streptomyces liangshanensis]|uniref:Uncharacterized protein n=1 Tax=Streptomyces liangshanensis TaxID=2717324 RepID=A0A6G9H3E3_9ACTN|nr:DUF5336 domain-containing protein [Streptomyces liangshanensis]QIQ05025.1 hypothetical protein HA039_24560 [Streptomyces liangshanensis]